MRTYFSALLCFVLLFSCKPSDDTMEPASDAEFVIVETDSQDFPIVMSHEDGELLALSLDMNNTLSGVHFRNNDTSYYIETDTNGLPVQGIFEDHLIFFNNYTENTVDIGILTPENESVIIRDVDLSSVDFSSLSNKGAQSDTTRALQSAGLGVSIFNCALSSALAVGSGGLATGLAILTCSSAVVSTISFLNPDNEVLGISSTGLSFYSGSLGCALLNPVDCIGFFLDVSATISGSLDESLERNREQAELLRSSLEFGGGDLQITLRWDNSADLDLYVTDPAGETISYQNTSSASGGQLDVDDIDGIGPENIFWSDNAPAGTYSVMVDHFSGASPSNFSVRVQLGGIARVYNGTISSNQMVNVVSFNTSTGLPNKSANSASKSTMERKPKVLQ